MDPLAVGLVLVAAGLVLVATVGAVVCYQLLLQHGRTLLRVEALERALVADPAQRTRSAPAPDLEAGLPTGSVLLDFELPALGGGQVTLSSWRERRILLTFVQPGCAFSRRLLPRIAELASNRGDGCPVPVVVTTGDPDQNRRWFGPRELRCPVLLQEGTEVAMLNWVSATPAAYLVGERGITAAPLAVGAREILALAGGAGPGIEALDDGRAASDETGATPLPRDQSLGDALAEPIGLAVGTAAPSFRVPRLEGGELTVADLRGRRTLLIFADPSCEACVPLLPALEELHRAEAGPSVLMISRGSLEANRDMVARHGLTLPIGIQRHWDVSRAFGLLAAPVGFLIDERGVIAAEAAVGVERIRALIPPGTNDGAPGKRWSIRRVVARR